MNQQQVMGLIRQALPLAAGVATTLGYVSPEQVDDLTAKFMAATGPVLALVSAGWSWASKTDKALVASVIAMPEVQTITTMATPEGEKLADSVPDKNVVAALTPARSVFE